MASSETMKQVFAVFLLVVISLAFTPSVASFVTDAEYTEYTDSLEVVPATSNSTTTTYTARNDSSTYAYFTITLNTTSAYGLTTIEEATNITYTVATKTLTFKSGVLTSGTAYLVTVVYYTEDLTSTVVLALLPIVPILWVVAVLAVGVVMVTVLLKRQS
jgi:hypothetical protein